MSAHYRWTECNGNWEMQNCNCFSKIKLRASVQYKCKRKLTSLVEPYHSAVMLQVSSINKLYKKLLLQDSYWKRTHTISPTFVLQNTEYLHESHDLSVYIRNAKRVMNFKLLILN